MATADVLSFPDQGARAWRTIEAAARDAYGGTAVDGPAFEDALARLREHFEQVFRPFDCMLRVCLPESTSTEVRHAVSMALADAGRELDSAIERERSAVFAILLGAELRLAYWLRNGVEL